MFSSRRENEKLNYHEESMLPVWKALKNIQKAISAISSVATSSLWPDVNYLLSTKIRLNKNPFGFNLRLLLLISSCLRVWLPTLEIQPGNSENQRDCLGIIHLKFQ